MLFPKDPPVKAEAQALIEADGCLSRQIDAQIHPVSAPVCLYQLQELLKSRSSIAAPLVRLLHHEPIQPPLIVVAVHTVHGKAHRSIHRINGQWDAFRLHIGLGDGLRIGAHQLTLVYPDLKPQDGVKVFRCNRT